MSMVGLRMINGCGTCERKETLGAMNSTAVTGPVMVNGTDDAALGSERVRHQVVNWRRYTGRPPARCPWCGSFSGDLRSEPDGQVSLHPALQ